MVKSWLTEEQAETAFREGVLLGQEWLGYAIDRGVVPMATVQRSMAWAMQRALEKLGLADDPASPEANDAAILVLKGFREYAETLERVIEMQLNVEVTDE